MPTWLAVICGIATLATAAYLLYVILRPDRF